MKIKFIKEYVAFYDFDGGFEASNSYKAGKIKDVTSESAQWLIDNGFAEEVKESGWWKPKYDEEYFYIGHDGFVHPCLWANDPLDNGRLKLGSVFKTEEAAICCRDYWEAIVTVRQDEGVLTPEQVDELIKDEGLAYCVGYMGNRGNGEILCGCPMSFDDCWMPVGAILFDSEVHADRSLKNHPDEWKIIVNYDWGRETEYVYKERHAELSDNGKEGK